MTIHERIKYHRKKNNYTQQELADKIPMSRDNYASMESGRHSPTIPQLISLSKTFNISLDLLITGKEFKGKKI